MGQSCEKPWAYSCDLWKETLIKGAGMNEELHVSYVYKPTSNQLSSSLNCGNLPYTMACQRTDWILFKWICALPCSNSLILKFQIDIYVRRIILFFFLSFFLMCTVFFFFPKVFMTFVPILLLFYVLVFWPWGMWNLSSPTRYQTHTPLELLLNGMRISSGQMIF